MKDSKKSRVLRVDEVKLVTVNNIESVSTVT